MRTMREILERQEKIRAELRSLHEAAGDDGSLAPEAQARWNGLMAEKATLEQRAARQASLDDFERNAPARPVGGGALQREVRVFGAPTTVPPGFDGGYLRAQSGELVPVLEHRHRLADFAPQTETRATELGFGGFLRALHFGPRSELERRVLAEAAVGTGGAMVPTPLSAEIIDLMRARAVAFRAGVRTVPMTSQTLRYARVVDDLAGGWRAENAPITEDQPGFDSVTLTARSWALLTRISRELLEDGQNVDAVLRAAFASAAALALDQAILFGTGAANQPLGVANTAGIQTVSMGANGAALADFDPFLDAIAALEAANAGEISAIVHAPRTARTLYGFTATDGQPLQPPPRLAGIPQLVTSAVPINLTQGTANNASTVLLGDWSEVYVGMRTALTVTTLTERYAENGQVGFVSWLRADVLMARPAAMARIVGVVPA